MKESSQSKASGESSEKYGHKWTRVMCGSRHYVQDGKGGKKWNC